MPRFLIGGAEGCYFLELTRFKKFLRNVLLKFVATFSRRIFDAQVTFSSLQFKMAKSKKCNWTNESIHKLLDHIEEHHEKLLGKFSSSLSAKDKKQLWETISNDFPDREMEEVKRKFFNVKAEKVRTFAAYKKKVVERLYLLLVLLLL